MSLTRGLSPRLPGIVLELLVHGAGFGGKRPSHGAQLPGKMRPLAVRSLQGEELIVVRTRDVWKIDLGTATGTSHDLYSREPYKMATFYAKFTERRC